MDKLRMTTADGVQDNVEKIALLFPDCVTETRDNNTGRLVHKVDFDKLRQELSGSIVSDRELRQHEVPLYRGRQPRCAEMPKRNLSAPSEDDLHRPAL